MKRRDSLKVLAAGTVAGVTATTIGCKESTTVENDATSIDDNLYGRTASEKEWDQKIMSETFLNEHEMATIAILCDIILPAKGEAGSATEAEVPEFIEFIVKDIPDNQIPVRGGLMWLDGESNKRFNKTFVKCAEAERIQIVEDIAYPLKEGENSDLSPGIHFFDKIRDLTLSGYYTTRMGFRDLGYRGNIPGIWDGVPEDVLAEFDVDYDPEWIAKCVNQDTRETIAEWDDDMNLIT